MCENRWQNFQLCRLQKTIGILQESLTRLDMEGTHSNQSNDDQLCLLKEVYIYPKIALHPQQDAL